MSLEVMSAILIGGFLLLLVLGLEIAVVIGIVASFGLVVFAGRSLNQLPYTAWSTMNSFVLTAMPLFIFMGAIFSSTGIVRRLFSGADKFIGTLPGGVACSVIIANAIFGALSGSSIAAAATFGKIAFPEMEELGYDSKLSLGIIAVAGTISVLIPPSLVMIVYGGWLNVPVPELFAGGLIPGLVLTLLLILTAVLLVKLNPRLAPRTLTYSWKERFAALKEIAPFLVVIVIVLGAIFLGIMTPTESAALGALLGVLLALIYKKMSFAALKESMLDAVRISSMVALIVTMAGVMGQVFQYLGLTQSFQAYMSGLTLGRYEILAIISVIYIFLGCFFDSFSMLLLTLPFIGPLMTGLGFDLVWFGVFYVILAEIGLVTPPFGLNLFALQVAVPKYDIMTIVRGSFPFLVPLLLMLVLLAVFPQLVLWLPSKIY